VRGKILRTAAEHFECAEADLLLADGQVAIKGCRSTASRSERWQRWPIHYGAVRPGTEPGLEATAYFGPAKGATAAGARAMIVEIDPETMKLCILKYVVVHDCGTVINPLIVDGQIQGGVAQGFGNAFYERLAFDEQGQLINATLADYLLPTATEVPGIEILHHVTPSPYNELGVKGVGEAGAIPVGALFAQAIEDALELPVRGIDILEIPLGPQPPLGLAR
jgi:CO/xanthine dehydrogenase Mo-binding subunit